MICTRNTWICAIIAGCVLLSIGLWLSVFCPAIFGDGEISAEVTDVTDVVAGVVTTDITDSVEVSDIPVTDVSIEVSTEVSTDESTLDTSTSPETEEITPLTKQVVYLKTPLDEDLQDHIFALCETYGLDPRIVFGVISKESSYRPKLMGDGGESYGLMQVQPKWREHQELMDKFKCYDLLDPYQNVTIGIAILAGHYDRGKGIEWALMAYNGGASYANKMLAAGKVSSYAKKVLERAAALEAYIVEKEVS